MFIFPLVILWALVLFADGVVSACVATGPTVAILMWPVTWRNAIIVAVEAAEMGRRDGQGASNSKSTEGDSRVRERRKEQWVDIGTSHIKRI